MEAGDLSVVNLRRLSAGIGAALALAAPARAESVQQLFEKYKLVGVFAVDCGKPADPGNVYQVIRLIDANAAQIDEMSGPTTRAGTIFVDRAESVRPNVLKVVGTLNDFPLEAVWQIEPQRQRLIEAKANGVELVRDGVHLITRQTAAYFNRCKSP
jgi:hypothetical protein